ncbi:MAG: hypothetical protein EP343_31490 [Deltaproteobacteria bacterium]|nr:MAG: hypothetical protein EP343_31490 [Deltaproteobacteria bacterium]
MLRQKMHRTSQRGSVRSPLSVFVLLMFVSALVWAGSSACTDGFVLPDGGTLEDGGTSNIKDDNSQTTDKPTNNPDTPTGKDDSKPADRDTPVPDDNKPTDRDTPPPDTVNPPEQPPVEPDPPKPLELVSAFSRDGRNITCRFNQAVDLTTGAVKANFRTVPPLTINEAKVENEFVHLIIDPSSNIDGNTLYTVWASNLKSARNTDLSRAANNSVVKRTLYVALVWHQHQPMYLDPLKDEMQGPWVRKHATKSYYDMAAVVEPYKDVHYTINLTPVLLIQLQRYIDRLGPFYNAQTNRIDAKGFLAKWARKTDPWIDLLLTPTPEPSQMSKRERGLFYDDPWATVSTSPQVMAFWPQYEALRDKNRAQYTKDDLLKLKFFFELAWFDPSFVYGPVKMPDGSVVDLSDIIEKRNGKYYTKIPITEDLCNRMVAENYKIMKNVVAIHKKLIYDPRTKKGQIEVITTPFYHPILPLIYNTDLAKQTPFVDDIQLPPQRFSFPDDAFAHVAKAKLLYTQMFGFPPQGMWPGEGSVAEDLVDQFVKNGVRWIATGQDNLSRSKPGGQQVFYPYKVDSDKVQGNGGDDSDNLMILFRDNKVSDLIGFGLQSLSGEDSSNRLISDILKFAPRFGEKDRLLTIILDGENAWENYTQDHGAVEFFNKLYAKLNNSFKIGEIITVTPTEYMDGNPARNVPAHPVKDMQELEPLNPGSWIDGTFRVWIGENEETCGWNYLLQTRLDLESVRDKVPRPNPLAPAPPPNHPLYNAYRAWEAMYAAQGSDWFWWFGDDMTTPANDDSGFDIVFRALLTSVYEFANKAGASLKLPVFKPCVQPKPKPVPNTPCSQCPQINGKFDPDPTEWTADGGFVKDDDSADPNNPDADDDIAASYVAFNTSNLFIGLLHNEDLSKKSSNYKIAIYFSHRNILDKATGKRSDDKPVNAKTPGGIDIEMKTGGAARRLLLTFGSTVSGKIQKADGNGGWTDQSGSNVKLGGPTPGGKLLEISIPWSDLNLKVSPPDIDPLQLLIVAEENGKEIDRSPNFGSFTVFEDSSDAILVTFSVDISGKEEPINKYGTCCKQQPKPNGPASVFIVGNHRSLGMVGVDAQGKPVWVPNKIQMNQDPNNPNLWTYKVSLPNGMKVNYKYTIGTNSDEGRWRQTEEFPVTFRGFDIKDPSGKRCIKVEDIFANKPTGGRDGEVGSKSKLTVGCTR